MKIVDLNKTDYDEYMKMGTLYLKFFEATESGYQRSKNGLAIQLVHEDGKHYLENLYRNYPGKDFTTREEVKVTY